jgi:chorismate mutase
MAVRGIRGATAVNADTQEAILAATRELLETVVATNRVSIEDIASITFTVTPDLKSEYPARAARLLGWKDVALIGATEMDVATGLKHCIRVLLHVNTDTPPAEIKHIYLHEAKALRPDR